MSRQIYLQGALALFAFSASIHAADTVNCSSEDGKRHHCEMPTDRGVQMVKQRSGSPCERGRSWDVADRNHIWVDRGCRADFAPGGGEDGYARYGDGRGTQGQMRTFNCSSEDEHRHTCEADTVAGVRLIKQRSGTPCQRGYSWDIADETHIWVDHGCRADFESGGQGSMGGNMNGNMGQNYPGNANTIECSSSDGKRHYCGAGNYRAVEVAKQRSGLPCVEGLSWGHDAKGIWVDHGCRADFRAY